MKNNNQIKDSWAYMMKNKWRRKRTKRMKILRMKIQMIMIMRYKVNFELDYFY